MVCFPIIVGRKYGVLFIKYDQLFQAFFPICMMTMPNCEGIPKDISALKTYTFWEQSSLIYLKENLIGCCSLGYRICMPATMTLFSYNPKSN